MVEQATVWQDSNPAIFLVFLAILALIHFVPSFVAFSRNHASRKLILLLNVIMGWTVIGWALLLYWAAQGKKSGLLA